MLIVINDVSGSLGVNKPNYLGLLQSSMAHQFAGEEATPTN
jgi:hypothetical protein